MEKRIDNQLFAIPPGSYPGLLALLSEVDEFKGWWRGRFPADPVHLKDLRSRVISLSAVHSVGIDWSGVPRHPAFTARGRPTGSPPGEFRSRAETDYAEQLATVFDGYRELTLGSDLIRTIHGGILKHSERGRSHRGALRTAPDRALFLPVRSMESLMLRPADPRLIPQELEALIRWTNSRLASRAFHPLLVAACFVLEFLAMRPFFDGNGRVSRILTGMLLLQSGYAYMPYASLEKAIADRKAEYYIALRRSQASRMLQRPDMSPWLLAFLNAMRAQAAELKTLGERDPGERHLSGNQRGVMALADRHGEITNRLVAGQLRLPRETAKQVLNRLVALNLLERIGAGRAVRYRRAG